MLCMSSFLSPFVSYNIFSKSLDERETGSSPQNPGGGSLGPQHEAAAVSSDDENSNTTRSPKGKSQDESERPTSQNKSASPPVVSSTTTTATTPPSSPRTGTGSNFSSPDLKAPVSPRATLHAAAAAKAVGTKHGHTSIIRGSAVSGTGASSALAGVEQDTTNDVFEQLPPGVVQQYSSKDKADLTSADSLVSIKMLVSNNVAGSIIGRSGQSISELQAQSSSRIKLSQAGDFYPGTSDRVCLIQGDQAQVKRAISLIIKRIDELQKQAEQRGQQQSHRHEEEEEKEDQDHGAPSTSNDEKEDADPEDESSSPPSFIVRVLVPTPACGMIIGRGGSNIKNMAELSGVSSIRLSPKEYGEQLMQQGAPPHHHYHYSRHLHLQHHPQQRQQQHSDTPDGAATVTNERIVTISGPSLPSAISCVDLIIDGIAAHPEIGRYANMTTSYSRASSAAAATPTSRLALQSSTARPTSSHFYAPAGPYSTSRSAPAPTPIANAMPAGTSLTSMMMSPPSPMVQGHPHRQYGGNSSAHGDMDSLGSNQQQQAIHYHSPHHSQHVHTPSSVASPHHMYPGNPAAPIPTLNQPTYAPLSPQHTQPNDHRAAFLQSESQQLRSTMYSPVEGRSGSNVSGSRRSSQEEMRPSPPSQAAPSSISAQVGGMTPMAPLSPGSESTSSYVPETATGHPKGSLIQMSIPDSLIGAVLGRGGSTLNELQSSTNTRIRISQRGVYVPGTTNRVVTISGSTGESVATAQYLINQRLAKSNTERTHGSGGRNTSNRGKRDGHSSKHI